MPAGVLLDAVVTAAFRVPVAQAGPAACLVGDVVLEVAGCGRSSAAWTGARGVPDIRQVPERHSGIVAFGLVAVVALAGGKGPDVDEQVALAGDAGGESPGPVAAWRAGLVGAGEAEPGCAGRAGTAGFVVFSAAGGGGGTGAALLQKWTCGWVVGDRYSQFVLLVIHNLVPPR